MNIYTNKPVNKLINNKENSLWSFEWHMQAMELAEKKKNKKSDDNFTESQVITLKKSAYGLNHKQ